MLLPTIRKVQKLVVQACIRIKMESQAFFSSRNSTQKFYIEWGPCVALVVFAVVLVDLPEELERAVRVDLARRAVEDGIVGLRSGYSFEDHDLITG